MNSLDSSQAAGTESAINMQLQHVDESGVQVGYVSIFDGFTPMLYIDSDRPLVLMLCRP